MVSCGSGTGVSRGCEGAPTLFPSVIPFSAHHPSRPSPLPPPRCPGPIPDALTERAPRSELANAPGTRREPWALSPPKRPPPPEAPTSEQLSRPHKGFQDPPGEPDQAAGEVPTVDITVGDEPIEPVPTGWTEFPLACDHNVKQPTRTRPHASGEGRRSPPRAAASHEAPPHERRAAPHTRGDARRHLRNHRGSRGSAQAIGVRNDLIHRSRSATAVRQ